MNTVIVIGNGFDIDLGWRTSYKDFYVNIKNKWSIFETNEDDLFQCVIKNAKDSCKDNWFDFECILHEYVVKKTEAYALNVGKDIKIKIDKDIRDYKVIKTELSHFLSKRSEEPVLTNSYACQLLKAYLEKCKRLQLSSDVRIEWFSFNYTPLKDVAHQIVPDSEFNYIPIHGTIRNKNIILGFHDDDTILSGYRDLQKSMHDNYESHGIISAMTKADRIIFFGLSMGRIDAVYFKELFNKLINQAINNKEIIFITKDQDAKKCIKSNLLDMGLNLQVLFNVSNVDFILTSDSEKEENQAKLASLLEKLYLQDI